MPIMSKVEGAFCRSGPWRSFTRSVALPWVLDSSPLDGDVLEIGAGAGANAQVILESHPRVDLVATDLDPVMVDAAKRRLARFERLASVQVVDATQLPFDDHSFDVVISLLMLHHVIDWPAVLGEVKRVLRPGGAFVGYDLTARAGAQALHVIDRSPHRLLDPTELAAGLRSVDLRNVDVTPAFAGTVMKFRAAAQPETNP